MADTIHKAMEHVSYLEQYLHNCDISCMIAVILMDLEIQASGGNRYLKTAVKLVYENSPLLFEKGLYEVVASQFESFVTKEQVEVSIRRLIKAAWENRKPEKWQRYFVSNTTWMDQKPTNTDFISGICTFLELWVEMRESNNGHPAEKTVIHGEGERDLIQGLPRTVSGVQAPENGCG